MNIYAKVDTSGLSQAIRARSQLMSSKRTMRQIVATASYMVAMRAQGYMPYVPQGHIDSDLAVEYSFGTTPKGRPSMAKKNIMAGSGLFGATVRHSGIRKTHQVPLSALIIQSSSRPWSRYNTLTHSRYARAASPFKGVTRAAGRLAMRASVNRMIRGRHSSTHFLQAGWNHAINMLRGESVFKSRAGFPAAGKRGGVGQGEVVIRSDASSAWVYIANLAGAQSLNAQSFNEALWRHGTPGLQRAVDEETASMHKYVADKLNQVHAAAGLTR